jgi:hypothetical protein
MHAVILLFCFYCFGVLVYIATARSASRVCHLRTGSRAVVGFSCGFGKEQKQSEIDKIIGKKRKTTKRTQKTRISRKSYSIKVFFC